MSKFPGLSNDDLLVLAAQGRRDAQAELAERALASILTGEVSFAYGVQFAEVCARMAAAHGQQIDRLRLASILLYCATVAEEQGRHREMVELAAQGLAWASEVAAEGREDVAEYLNMAAETLPAEILRRAIEKADERPEIITIQ